MPDRTCACGGEMFVDSFDHPRREVKWLWRCRICGHTEDSTVDEAIIAYGERVRRATRDAGEFEG